jgi:endonuclease/exonuclease/phosphatase family metal-dependent hydrolase
MELMNKTFSQLTSKCHTSLRSFYLFLILTIFTSAQVVLIAQSSEFNGLLRIASYNIENYIVEPSETRPLKSDVSRDKVQDFIKKIDAHIIAIQEIGNTNSLFDLLNGLKAKGMHYQYWFHSGGFDTNIYLALLSKFPIVNKKAHMNESFLLHNKRFFVSRGILEADVLLPNKKTITFFVAHLKSRRASTEIDPAELREHEAAILRKLINKRFAENPSAYIVVVGDMNDTRDSTTLKTIIGRGGTALFDTRPTEKVKSSLTGNLSGTFKRDIAWTHYYATGDTYSRIDYILVSKPLQNRLVRDATFILNDPDWGIASDHRPITAGFSITD